MTSICVWLRESKVLVCEDVTQFQVLNGSVEMEGHKNPLTIQLTLSCATRFLDIVMVFTRS